MSSVLMIWLFEWPRKLRLVWCLEAEDSLSKAIFSSKKFLCSSIEVQLQSIDSRAPTRCIQRVFSEDNHNCNCMHFYSVTLQMINFCFRFCFTTPKTVVTSSSNHFPTSLGLLLDLLEDDWKPLNCRTVPELFQLRRSKLVATMAANTRFQSHYNLW